MRLRLLDRLDARTAVFQDALRITVLAMVTLGIGLAINAVHPLGLPLSLAKVTRPGVPAWVWQRFGWVTVDQAWQATGREHKALLVDARDQADYAIAHARGAIALPYYEYSQYVRGFRASVAPDTPVMIYCYGAECGLAIRVGNRLVQAGYTKVYIVLGGWADWVKKHLPVDGHPQEATSGGH